MAPPKGPRPTANDEAAAPPTTKQKAVQAPARSGKGANANRTNNGTAQSKDAKDKADRLDSHTLGNDRSAANIVGSTYEDDFSWISAPTSFLETYRNAHMLRGAPSAFQNPMATALLTCGIGRSSPTMLRPKDKRRVEKPKLANVVRASFANSYVKEMDVLVGFAYRGRMKGRHFRQRFPASLATVTNTGGGKSGGGVNGVGKT